MFNKLIRYIRLHILTSFLKNPINSRLSHSSPIFILSAGRSGSTLLRKILLQTKYISIPPETHGFIPAITSFYIKHNHHPWEILTDLLIDFINNEKRLSDWNIVINEDEKKHIKYSLLDKSLYGVIHFLYNKYGKYYHPQATLWGDKTPILIYHTDTLNKILPNAKYIFLIRDGRDVVSSFNKNKIYTDIVMLCQRWNYSIKISQIMLKKKGPSKVYLVKYEKLVQSPSSEIEKICQFLNIPFDNSYLNNANVHLGDDYKLHFSKVRDKITSERINTWETDLNDTQKEIIDKHLRKNLVKLRYK